LFCIQNISNNSNRLKIRTENLRTYIKTVVGLFTTEIYANWVRKEELERWV